MKYPQAIDRLKTLAHQIQTDTDNYAASVARDEFNLLALAFDVPEEITAAIMTGRINKIQGHAYKMRDLRSKRRLGA